MEVFCLHSSVHDFDFILSSQTNHPHNHPHHHSVMKATQHSQMSVHLSVRKQNPSNNFKSHSSHLHFYLHHNLYHHFQHHPSSFNFATFKLFSLFIFDCISEIRLNFYKSLNLWHNVIWLDPLKLLRFLWWLGTRWLIRKQVLYSSNGNAIFTTKRENGWGGCPRICVRHVTCYCSFKVFHPNCW